MGGVATGYDIAMASASSTDNRREVLDFSQSYFAANLEPCGEDRGGCHGGQPEGQAYWRPARQPWRRLVDQDAKA
ncbi:MAG: hypothetical protein E5X67_35130 [Mesorhizobium sp.]|nr:MAG: hypothetical protein E5X67_35130 [Mesorhizobium sp.]